MNTIQAQQKALDDALVATADRLEFGKCNVRLKTDIKPKEATFQVVLDTLALTPFYQAFLITKKVSLDVDMFREILKICPKIPGQGFEDLPLEQDILSFIRDLRHTGDITYLTDVNFDNLHQPWRAFATVMNKCLSRKETGMDKIRLSHNVGIQCWNPMLTRHTTLLPLERNLQNQRRKAKVAKSDKKKQPKKKLKAKGLAVLSEMTGVDEGTGNILGVLDVPIYEYERKKESWGDSEDEDDENDSDDIIRQNQDSLDQSTMEFYEEEEEEKLDDKETMNDDEDDEVTKELYEDVNVNLGNEDTEMTNADQGASEQQNVSQESGFEQVEEDAHLLNLENPSPTNNEIDSLMETSALHATAVTEFTSGFTTTIHPPPLFFNPLLQQATPIPTPTTSEATTSFPSLPDFASLFKFNETVTNIGKDLSEIMQAD
ncbi:hypothetical protein Tco_0132702 [Tanacetum coccineum]